MTAGTDGVKKPLQVFKDGGQGLQVTGSTSPSEHQRRNPPIVPKYSDRVYSAQELRKVATTACERPSFSSRAVQAPGCELQSFGKGVENLAPGLRYEVRAGR